MGRSAFKQMTDTAAPLRRSGGKKKKSERDREAKIDGWVSGLFNKATV